jgi:hypothetical protein
MKILLLLLTASALHAADLMPILAQPDAVVFQDDFSKPTPLNKQHWAARQGTQWAVEDGVLRGRPSTPEFQAKKKDHFGYEPRISAPITPPQFIAKLSVRFTGGSETAIVPFVEFGHHVCRLHFTKGGVIMLADHESTQVAESKELKYEPGKWYHLIAELKGDEIVVQFEGGPTLYAKHACLTASAPSGADGIGIAGPKDGTAEIDNVTLWSIKPEAQPAWAKKRETLPKSAPVPVMKKKGK